jgi:hypothetical protein
VYQRVAGVDAVLAGAPSDALHLFVDEDFKCYLLGGVGVFVLWEN